MIFWEIKERYGKGTDSYNNIGEKGTVYIWADSAAHALYKLEKLRTVRQGDIEKLTVQPKQKRSGEE